MSIEQPNQTAIPKPAAPSRFGRRTVLGTVAAAALLGIGAGAGAAGWSFAHHGPDAFDPSLSTTPIAKLSEGGPVELQGKVVEVFGNKFVVQDASGRALVETGRAGEGGKLVAPDEAVTVQGRFDDGFLHASALQRANGKVEELRPPPPPHPPHGPHGPEWDMPDAGPGPKA